jgi:glycosyltransferase involved in cell wall biosynthesis
MLLSLAFPTYNRKDAILTALDNCLKNGIFDVQDIEVVVSDNGSSDPSVVDSILEFREKHSINLVVSGNPKNEGPINNFKRCLYLSSCKYVLLSSDEDSINLDSLVALVNFLKANSPKFVSTRYLLNGSIYRNHHHEITRVSGNEFFLSSFYISGLVYERKVAKTSWIEASKYHEDPRNPYPLVTLAFMLSAPGEAFYFPEAVCYRHADLESEDNSYVLPENRLQQYLFFLEFVSWYSEHARQKNIPPEFVDAAFEQLGRESYWRFQAFIGNKFPHLLRYYVGGAASQIGSLVKSGQIKI